LLSLICKSQTRSVRDVDAYVQVDWAFFTISGI
jgi:hypothetical protein